NPYIKANYLASPPLVVAYAIAGTTDFDMLHEPLGQDPSGRDVFLRDIWPSQQEVSDAVARFVTPEMFRRRYANVFEGPDEWKRIKISGGELFDWPPDSTYTQVPPFFIDLPPEPLPIPPVRGARVL